MNLLRFSGKSVRLKAGTRVASVDARRNLATGAYVFPTRLKDYESQHGAYQENTLTLCLADN
jgi:hypothetical protein